MASAVQQEHDAIRRDTACVVSDVLLDAGESPRWDARFNMYILVDLHYQHVVFLKDDEAEHIPMPGRTGFIAPRALGGWLVSVNGALHVLSESRQLGPALCMVADVGFRINDGRCDGHGRLWAGSFGHVWEPLSKFYRVDTHLGVEDIFDGITCSNGLGWSMDERTFYYIDSATLRIDVCDFEPVRGRVSNRREFLRVPAGWGVPDGLAMDTSDNVWVALCNTADNCGRVVCCDPRTASITRIVEVPECGGVLACAFGGSDRGEMLITTLGGEHRNAGRLFRCDLDVQGQVEHAWGGR